MSNKICVIGVYFGKLIPYFELWLKSCEHNHSVDFLVFTDQVINNYPQNMKVFSYTLESFRLLTNEKLKMKVTLDKGYKCCDFRPAFGIILQDYIKEYDYWAHCDFDMMFGDLKYFFDNENLYSYDKFLTLGHLSLYRNTSECNKCFMLDGSKCGDFTEVFTSTKGHAFDEIEGILQIYKKHEFSIFDKRIFADISKRYKRFRLGLDDKNYKQQVFYWEGGKIYRAFYEQDRISTEEFIYIHFSERSFGKQTFNVTSAKSFFITPVGFIEKGVGIPTIEDIEKYNKFHGSFYERLELSVFNFNERFNLSMIFFRRKEKAVLP